MGMLKKELLTACENMSCAEFSGEVSRYQQGKIMAYTFVLQELSPKKELIIDKEKYPNYFKFLFLSETRPELKIELC